MNRLKIMMVSIVCACSFSSTALAENSQALQGLKLGFGYDMGLGITAQDDNINVFLGNDGLAIDYKFIRNNVAGSIPTHVYLGVGGYAGFGGSLGARIPVGIEGRFTPEFDAYAHVIPELNLINDVKFGLGAGLGVRYKF